MTTATQLWPKSALVHGGGGLLVFVYARLCSFMAIYDRLCLFMAMKMVVYGYCGCSCWGMIIGQHGNDPTSRLDVGRGLGVRNWTAVLELCHQLGADFAHELFGALGSW